MADIILKAPRRDEFFTPDGRPTLRFIKWIESITSGTNTSTAEITNVSVRESYAWDTSSNDTGLNGAKVQQLYPYIEHAPKEWRNITVTGGTYTALGHDFINAKANALIYFPEYPEVNAIFTVRNGDNSRITLAGNGKMLNGCSTGIIDYEETCIDWHYFIDSDEWFSK